MAARSTTPWPTSPPSQPKSPASRERLTAVRLDRANLAAAGRATIAAYHDGEPDPLSYLRDELHAQGFSTERGRP